MNFVKREDVISLLDRISDKDGFVDKGNLLVNIRELATYKDRDIEEAIPENNIKKNKSRSIYNIHDTIQNIHRYQNNVKFGLKKSSICAYFEKCLKMDIIDKKLKVFPTKNNNYVDFKDLEFDFKRYIEEKSLLNNSIVTSLKELEKILGITKGTSNNWQKKGIIKLHDIHIVVAIDNVVYNYKNRYTWFKYYDLEEIKKNIKNIV